MGGGQLSVLVTESEIEGIVYHGPLYDERLEDLYRQCDFFVFPTLWDAQPTVIVEAVSSGLKVLCSENMRGVFDDFNERGWLDYIHPDVDAFSNSMRQAAETFKYDFSEREQMHSFVEEHRSQKREISQILQFLSDLKKSRT